MKDKVENVPNDYRGSIRPQSTYASSASSTSSYASSLSSACSTTGSTSESVKSASSFLHSKANPLNDSNSSHGTAQQYHTLGRYPSGSTSPTIGQFPASYNSSPYASSPSSSPASSTFDGYATIPAKFSTMTLNPQTTRQDQRVNYTNPSVPTTPIVTNFRHSIISNPANTANFGDYNMTATTQRIGSNYNLTRVPDNGAVTGEIGEGMRGVSSLGEVTSSTHRSPHYASTPHLFVFQSIDDDSEGDGGDALDDASTAATRLATKCNTLSNRTVTSDERPQLTTNSTRTLPRLPQHSGAPQKEHIYSSTTDIKKSTTQREVSDYYSYICMVLIIKNDIAFVMILWEEPSNILIIFSSK